jgi:hypothetical protein
MLSSHRTDPIHIGVGNVFEPPGERNIRRERTLSKLLDAFNEVGRPNPDQVDPIGSYYLVSSAILTHRLFISHRCRTACEL